MRPLPPLRRELLLAFSVLFLGAVVVVFTGLTFLLPLFVSPTQGVVLALGLITGVLAVLFFLGGAYLRRVLLRPMQNLASDARRIAEGDFRHRVRDADSAELLHISQSVNAMADRLIADQALLADNVRSLDRTNRELVEARDQVLHSARLASVGTLAAGIAHEVGNPLGAIMAFADVARSRADRDGQDTELLDSIRDEAKRIDTIVRGLLDYARPQKAVLAPAPPTDVLDRVKELLENQGQLDRVEVTWAVHGEIPQIVMEPARLEQVLVNLLLNALHAIEGVPNPHLRVELRVEEGEVARLPSRRADDPPGIDYMHRRRVSKDDGGRGIDPLFTAREVVVLTVSDNGPGIGEEDLVNVFDPFFTTKEVGKGTGLGLSICARLVEGMGGRIEAANNPEGGARFTIRLPAVPESDPVATNTELPETIEADETP